MIAKDYTVFKLHGRKRVQVKRSMIKTYCFKNRKIKNGDFDDWMLPAIVKNLKLDDPKWNESNSYRARKMTNAFIMGEDWNSVVNKNDKLSLVTKNDIIEFVNKYFDSNYKVLNKLTGKPQSVKVEKPEITTIL